MAYPPRLFVEGYWYHVYTRGQRQEPLYFSPLDRIVYLSFLDRELERRGGVIGSYCLMTNHVHLLIQMGKTDLGKIFKTLHMKYAKYFNLKRDTKGYVFQGRPGMKIVLDDSYLLQVVGYIHLNPVEAGMVTAVDEFEWGSWKWLLEGEKRDLARSCYPPGFDGKDRETVFRDVVENKVELPFGENYWGTDEEWAKIDRRQENREAGKTKERRGRRKKDTIARELVEGFDVTIEQLKSPSQNQTVTKYRREAMGRMYEEGYGPTEIGKYFNRTKGAVNHAYRQWIKERSE
jgi:REP element-mobilizing transposase RayT